MLQANKPSTFLIATSIRGCYETLGGSEFCNNIGACQVTCFHSNRTLNNLLKILVGHFLTVKNAKQRMRAEHRNRNLTCRCRQAFFRASVLQGGLWMVGPDVGGLDGGRNGLNFCWDDLKCISNADLEPWANFEWRLIFRNEIVALVDYEIDAKWKPCNLIYPWICDVALKLNFVGWWHHARHLLYLK